MVKIDDDMNIELTRGDIMSFSIKAKDKVGNDYTFQVGDVIRFKVTEKGNVENVLIQKDNEIIEETKEAIISFNHNDTKIGDFINKPVKYWYEVELNPDTLPQTIIGYTTENGAKIFTLLPEGGDFSD